MKTIQITIEENLLQNVDAAVDQIHSTRSAFVRQALENALLKLRTHYLEEKHRRGYQKKPVQKNEFDVWEDEQVWGD